VQHETRSVPRAQHAPARQARRADIFAFYVANGRSNSVTVIDTASNAVIKVIPVGQMTWGVHIWE